MVQSINLGNAVVTLTADVKQFAAGINAAQDELIALSGGINSVTSTLTNLGAAFTLVGGTVLKGLTDVAVAGAEFEASISAVSAVVSELDLGVLKDGLGGVADSASTAEDRINAISDTIKDLAETTIFSATEVSKAAEILGLAGLSATEIISSLSAVTDLAAAGMIETADAANVAVNVFRAFDLETTQLRDVVDTFAIVQSNANVTIEQMGQAFKFVSPAAGSFGQSVADVSALLGLLGDAGIRASIAGTGLARAFSKLATITDKQRAILNQYGIALDAINPQFNSITDIIRQFRDANLSAGDAVEFFGERAGRTIQTLVNVSDERFEGLIDTVGNRFGEAFRQAELRIDNVKGSFLKLVAAFDTLKATVFDTVSEKLKSLLNTVLDVVKGLTDFVENNKEFVASLVTALAVISAFSVAFGVFLVGFSLAAAAVAGAVLAFVALGSAITTLTASADKLQKQLTKDTAKLSQLNIELAVAATSAERAAIRLKQVKLDRRITKNAEQLKKVSAATDILSGKTTSLRKAFGDLFGKNFKAGVNAAKGVISSFVTGPLNLLTERLFTAGGAWKNLSGSVKTSGKAILGFGGIIKNIGGSLVKVITSLFSVKGILGLISGLLLKLGAILGVVAGAFTALGLGAVAAALGFIAVKLATALKLWIQTSGVLKIFSPILKFITGTFVKLVKIGSKVNDFFNKFLGITKNRAKLQKESRKEFEEELEQQQDVNDAFTRFVPKLEERNALLAKGTDLQANEAKRLRELTLELNEAGIKEQDLIDTLKNRIAATEELADASDISEEQEKRLRIELENLEAALAATEETQKVNIEAMNKYGEALLDTVEEQDEFIERQERIEKIRIDAEQAREELKDLRTELKETADELEKRLDNQFVRELKEVSERLDEVTEKSQKAAEDFKKARAAILLRSEQRREGKENEKQLKELVETRDNLQKQVDRIAAGRERGTPEVEEGLKRRIKQLNDQIAELEDISGPSPPFAEEQHLDRLSTEIDQIEQRSLQERTDPVIAAAIRQDLENLRQEVLRTESMLADDHPIIGDLREELELHKERVETLDNEARSVIALAEQERRLLEGRRADQVKLLKEAQVERAERLHNAEEVARLEREIAVTEAEKTVDDLFTIEGLKTQQEIDEVLRRKALVRDLLIQNAKEEEKIERESAENKRRDFIRDLKKENLERKKRFIEAAEFEIEEREEQFKKEVDELRLSNRQKAIAEREFQNEIASIRNEAREKQAEEDNKASGLAEQRETIEEEAAKNLAKQVDSVSKLVALHKVLFQIRAAQERRFLRLTELQAQEENKAVNLARIAHFEPTNQRAQNRLRESAFRARALEQITRGFAAREGFGAPKDLEQIFPNIHDTLRGMPEAFKDFTFAARTASDDVQEAFNPVEDLFKRLQERFNSLIPLLRGLGPLLLTPPAQPPVQPPAQPPAQPVEPEEPEEPPKRRIPGEVHPGEAIPEIKPEDFPPIPRNQPPMNLDFRRRVEEERRRPLPDPPGTPGADTGRFPPGFIPRGDRRRVPGFRPGEIMDELPETPGRRRRVPPRPIPNIFDWWREPVPDVDKPEQPNIKDREFPYIPDTGPRPFGEPEDRGGPRVELDMRELSTMFAGIVSDPLGAIGKGLQELNEVIKAPAGGIKANIDGKLEIVVTGLDDDDEALKKAVRDATIAWLQTNAFDQS